MRKTIIFIYFILVSLNSISSQIELKTNIPTLALGIANIGIEFQVGNKTSLQLDVLGSFWDSVDGVPLHINQTFLEYRYYTNSNISG
tara:strand:+ start:533 stop:793 length:261 start_codon:yes stop_codon:yes gene_type:complete